MAHHGYFLTAVNKSSGRTREYHFSADEGMWPARSKALRLSEKNHCKIEILVPDGERFVKKRCLWRTPSKHQHRDCPG